MDDQTEVLCMCFPNEWRTCGTVEIRSESVVPPILQRLRRHPSAEESATTLTCGLPKSELRVRDRDAPPWRTCTLGQREECLGIERARWR